MTESTDGPFSENYTFWWHFLQKKKRTWSLYRKMKNNFLLKLPTSLPPSSTLNVSHPFNRHRVVGAVIQRALSFIHWFINWHTIRARYLKKKKMSHPPVCHLSHFICHVTHGTSYVSRVFFLYKVLDLVNGGSVMNRASPSSFILTSKKLFFCKQSNLNKYCCYHVPPKPLLVYGNKKTSQRINMTFNAKFSNILFWFERK